MSEAYLSHLVSKSSGLHAKYTFDDIIGKSKAIVELKKQAKSISNSPSTVLIQGESGTGKELFAQSIHNNSSRRNKNFVALNSGAIPKNLIESELFGYEEGAFTGARKGGHPGKFELAHEGTLFLDEIGEMSLDMQIRLLRILQDGCVTRLGGNKCIATDVRVIASTNKDLKKKVKKGSFRKDLYYRLSVIPLYLPPLREREGDIELLVQHFLKEKSRKLNKPIPKIRDDIYEKILNHSWPGNVRELENCIENIVNLEGDSSFSFDEEKTRNYKDTTCFNYDMCTLREWEKRAILACVEKCDGNITKAASILGINRCTLYSKLDEYKKEEV